MEITVANLASSYGCFRPRQRGTLQATIAWRAAARCRPRGPLTPVGLAVVSDWQVSERENALFDTGSGD